MSRRNRCECGRPIYVRKQGKRHIADAEHNQCRQCYERLTDASRKHPDRPFYRDQYSEAAE